MGFRKFNGHLTEIENPVPGVDTAINVLRPGARWELYNKEFVGWEHDEGLEPPTWDEIQEEVKREVEIYNYYLYERNRAKEFPELKDQLDMLYWDVASGLFGEQAKQSIWFQDCSGVKADFPKPN